MSNSCMNCGTPFTSEQKFCSACGQRTNVSTPVTMRDIGHDLVHAITHADHSIFALIRSLVTRPGYVARDFIEGRRKRHFGPFAFLLISVGVASAVIHWLGEDWFAPFKHGHAGDLLQRYINLVILLRMPLLAVFCALLFRGARLSFAEHLVLAAYTSGFNALFSAFVETPLLAMAGTQAMHPWLAGAYILVWLVYFSFAASQFYAGHRLWSATRAAVAVLLSQAATIGILMGVLFITSRLLAT
jgi:hypothetical protein